MTDDREVRPQRRVDVLLDLWVLVPVVVLCWPLLTRRGYPFSRDLVFTPRAAAAARGAGPGHRVARARPPSTPSSALLGAVVDGAVVGRVAVVLGASPPRGGRAHRLVRPLGVPGPGAGRWALAVWNPFVVERLGLGQWALLAGYAALFGVVAPPPRTDPDAAAARGRAARLAPWLAPRRTHPDGRRPRRGHDGGPRRAVAPDAGLLVLAAAVQLPWLLPALLGGGRRRCPTPRRWRRSRRRAERPGPAVLSLVGLGGIWDAQSVPGYAGRGGSATPRRCWSSSSSSSPLRRGLGAVRRSDGRPGWWGLGCLVVAAADVGRAGSASVVADLTEVVPGAGPAA